MRRGMNPLAVLMLIASAVVAFGAALIVRQFIPDSISEWSGLIFWGMVILLGGIGAIVSGKFINRRR